MVTKQSYAVNKHYEEYDEYIGRGSIWGNPYTHRELGGTKAQYKVSTREEAVAKYEEYLRGNGKLLNEINRLKGKRLGCFCKPKSCHGDILSKVANSKDEVYCVMLLKKNSLLFTRDYVSGFFIWYYENQINRGLGTKDADYELKVFKVDKEETNIYNIVEEEKIDTSKELNRLTGISEEDILEGLIELYE